MDFLEIQVVSDVSGSDFRSVLSTGTYLCYPEDQPGAVVGELGRVAGWDGKLGRDQGRLAGAQAMARAGSWGIGISLLVFSSLGDIGQEGLCLYLLQMKGGKRFCYTKMGRAEHPVSDKKMRYQRTSLSNNLGNDTFNKIIQAYSLQGF